MPKTLLHAPAAAGKTAYAIRIALEASASLQAQVRICVPTPLQANAWRRRLAAAGGAMGIHLLTFNSLATACLDEAGQTFTKLREPIQYRLLRALIGTIPLAHYAPIQSKPGFVQVMQRLISELKSGLIYPPDFIQAVAAMGDEPRLHELAQIYNDYQERLQRKKWADSVGLYWLAVETLQNPNQSACRDWPLLIVDGFDDFTPSQLALLQLLAERVGEFIITLPQAAAVDYPRYRRTRRQVEEELGITAQALPEQQPESHPTLQHLAAHIFTLSAADPLPAGEAITMREAADRPAEVRTALRWLKQRIVTDEIPPDQTALLAREIAPYHSTIQQIAAEFGLPVRLVGGLPLAQSPVIAGLMALLHLFLPAAGGVGPDLPRRQLISAWRSPYFIWRSRDWRIAAADADLLDTLAREQRVIRGLEQWQAAFTAGLAIKERELPEEEEGERHPLTAGVVQNLQQKFAYFLQVTKPPAETASLQDFIRWLERLIGPDEKSAADGSAPSDSLAIVAQARANSETEKADIAALQEFKALLRSFMWAEEALGPTRKVTFLSFYNELRGAISATRFSLPARKGTAEILGANVTQARGLSFAAVAVLGLSEGAFPQTINEDPFLRDLDRQRLGDQFKLTLQPSTRSAEQEYFYEAITRPRQKLLLTRPVLAENGAEWVSSPFWEAVRRLITCMPEQIPSEPFLDLAETASAAEWWETLAGLPGDLTWAGSADASVWQDLQTAAHIWQTRQAAQPSIWEGDLHTLAPQLARRQGPDRIWSASRLETYQTCAFLFFLQYILGLEPRPEPAEGLDARQLGSLYHEILEKAVQAGTGDMSDAAQVLALVTAVAAPILDAAPREQGFRATPWWLQTRSEIIQHVAGSLVALAAGDYDFLRAEASFGIDSKPLTIAGEGDRLRLRGFIDRVDRQAGGRIRIIDYKLGSPYSYNARAFAEGKRLQLPLYALAAEETLRLGTVADGFYWHVRHEEASPFKLVKAEGGVLGAIETTVAFAWDVVHNVRQGQFKPEPPDQGCPAYCPAASFCWQYTPGAW